MSNLSSLFLRTEPPKFKINKKLPQGMCFEAKIKFGKPPELDTSLIHFSVLHSAAPPSPPATIQHSPPRKITVKEQQEWKIPPCISNWKNPKGYTIPLDKRLAADGRGMQQVHVNENFSKLSESLYIVERKAREAVEMRAKMERERAQREKEEKEETLRKLAQKAREERAGIRNYSDDEEDDDYRERNQLRQDRNRERQRDRNIQRAAPEKRSRLERERDISEEIALGLANPGRSKTNEVQFDQRLFNQSKGLASGFGDDEEYSVYDKPWKAQNNLGGSLYKFTKRTEEDKEEELDTLKTSTRFVSEKGADKNNKRSGPVEFEKDLGNDDDPFGLDRFLIEAKKASKKPKTSSSDSSSKRRYD